MANFSIYGSWALETIRYLTGIAGRMAWMISSKRRG
jgi:hypothetical protein